MEQAKEEHRLDLEGCYVVGDTGGSDMLAASRAGSRLVLVETGRGERSLGEYKYLWPDIEPDHIAKNLLEAVQWIKDDLKTGGVT